MRAAKPLLSSVPVLMALALTATTALVSRAAHAAAQTSIHATATAGFGAETITVADNLPLQNGPSQAQRNANAYWGQAGYAATAEFGALHIYAEAATRGSNNYGGYNGWDSIATAFARAHDRVTFNAPAGVDWVLFTLSLDLHGEFTGSGLSTGLLEAEFGGDGYQPLEGAPYSLGLSAGTYFGYTPPARSEVLHASKTFRARPGSTISLSYSLQATAHADPFPAQAGILPPSRMVVDGGNTARFGISVLTPGANFISESGATYAPVPEPSALLLTGAGMLAASFSAYKRRMEASRRRS